MSKKEKEKVIGEDVKLKFKSGSTKGKKLQLDDNNAKDDDKEDIRTKQVYDFLAPKAEKRKQPTSDEIQKMCKRLSDLSQNEALGVKNIIIYHQKLYSGKRMTLSLNKYPYEGMEDIDDDLKVNMELLPSKLRCILMEYILSLDNNED